MNTARHTDERLRTALNSDQVSRERMCLAVLAQDRNYADIRPRRPEGGPDGGRDIQCMRKSKVCFGAVGFLNSVSDSPANKRGAKKKFKLDVATAMAAEPKLDAFVFFTNVDLTPTEIKELSDFGENQGLSFVDIYWRERIRHVLDSPEGLATRFNYLGIEMSAAEQASFFSRFGSELENLMRGGISSIEKKIDALEFGMWKKETVRKIILKLDFSEPRESECSAAEHFRVFLELQSLAHEKRGILIGGRDDYWEANGKRYFDRKGFFWREAHRGNESVWIPRPGGRAGGGIVPSIEISIQWRPYSHMHVTELDGLSPLLYVTENLVNQVARIRLIVDSYLLIDHKIDPDKWKVGKPHFDWPETLTADEEKLDWRVSWDLWPFFLEASPQKVIRDD